jgi:sugar lactone lactonase YvrE
MITVLGVPVTLWFVFLIVVGILLCMHVTHKEGFATSTSGTYMAPLAPIYVKDCISGTCTSIGADTDRLTYFQRLYVGGKLVSANGRYVLFYQPTGVLLLNDLAAQNSGSTTILWSSDTKGPDSGTPSYLTNMGTITAKATDDTLMKWIAVPNPELSNCPAGQSAIIGGQCTKCPAGKSSVAGRECTNCPAGQSSISGQLCKPCANGQSSVAGGLCSVCSPGYYCPGGVAAVACAAGQSSTEGKACTACPAGQTSVAGGACTACPAGYYCPGGESVVCPAGKTSAGGTTARTLAACTNCPAGQSSVAGRCTVCSDGYYCPGGAAPQECPAGQTSAAGGACRNCLAGQISVAGGTCTDCSAGFSSVAGGASCSIECKIYGQTSVAGGVCTNCPDGQALASGGASCVKCPAGQSSQGGAACTNCPAGKYSSEGAAMCTNCPAGQSSGIGESSCTNCPAGQSSNAGEICKDCPAGQSSLSGEECKNCPAGQSSLSGKECKNCLAGQTSRSGQACTDCPAGLSSVAGGAVCTYLCAAGQISVAGQCVCPAGKTMGAGNQCVNCPAGQTSAVGGACTNCPMGTSSVTGGTCTLPCPVGYYCPGGPSVPCPAGKTSTGGTTATVSGCTDCPAGKTTTTPGACTDCPAGKSSRAGEACTDCPAGQSSRAGEACTNCPAGQNSLAGGICTACPAGQTSVVGGVCCAPGYISVAGSLVCTACPAGYYCPGGASVPCPAGKSSTGGAAATSLSACASCSAGHYCPGGTPEKRCQVISLNPVPARVEPLGNEYFYALAIDAAGNIHTVDNALHRIRKITSAQIISTQAGGGTNGMTSGFANATGTSARFNTPRGIALDSGGNLYIADSTNHRIRMLTPAGVVTTFAGTGTAGFYDSGSAIFAQFRNPSGVAVDNLGSIYVADTDNHRIRKITSAGAVTTLAGSGTAGFINGTGIAARFNFPSAVAVDSARNVYVVDKNNYRIRKITSTGVVSTLAGSGVSGFADGTGTAAQFSIAFGIAVDSTGNVYVGDTDNHRIRKITAAGVVTTFAGSGTAAYLDDSAPSARFNSPRGIAIDSAGNVYVADYSNSKIRKIPLTCNAITGL